MTKITCPTCDGERAIQGGTVYDASADVPECDIWDCTTCGATGEVDGDEMCASCNGTGDGQVPEARCPDCDGRGVDQPNMPLPVLDPSAVKSTPDAG